MFEQALCARDGCLVDAQEDVRRDGFRIATSIALGFQPVKRESVLRPDRRSVDAGDSRLGTPDLRLGGVATDQSGSRNRAAFADRRRYDWIYIRRVVAGAYPGSCNAAGRVSRKSRCHAWRFARRAKRRRMCTVTRLRILLRRKRNADGIAQRTIGRMRHRLHSAMRIAPSKGVGNRLFLPASLPPIRRSRWCDAGIDARICAASRRRPNILPSLIPTRVNTLLALSCFAMRRWSVESCRSRPSRLAAGRRSGTTRLAGCR